MKKTERKSSKLGIKEIVTLFLLMIFVILLIVICMNLGKGNEIRSPLESLRYELKHSDYADIYMGVRRCNRMNYKGNAEYAKYEAIADYLEAAVDYKVHDKLGVDTVVKDRELMQEALIRMRDLNFAAEDINDLLDIEP